MNARLNHTYFFLIHIFFAKSQCLAGKSSMSGILSSYVGNLHSCPMWCSPTSKLVYDPKQVYIIYIYIIIYIYTHTVNPSYVS